MQYEPFQIFVNHNQNKQKTEPKIKKTQNPQYEPFRIFNLLPPFYNPQMPFP